jgi:hypothetical protein
LRTLSGPTSLFLGDSGAGAAITSPFIALSSSRQSSGNFYQAFQTTQAYSGDFFNVNAGNGGGTFTGNFCNYTIANVSKFAVSFTGLVTTVASVNLQSGTAIPAGGTAGAGLLMSSVANFGVFFGSGAPGLSAAKGSLYLRSDGSGVNDRMYVNTNGSTTWTAVVTVA